MAYQLLDKDMSVLYETDYLPLGHEPIGFYKGRLSKEYGARLDPDLLFSSP